jgi:hypothetical protein
VAFFSAHTGWPFFPDHEIVIAVRIFHEILREHVDFIDRLLINSSIDFHGISPSIASLCPGSNA